MKSRILHCLILLVIVACPLFCISGLCAPHCCADTPPVEASCEATACPPETCCEKAPARPPQPREGRPRPAPSCQGFCGAVVLGKPIPAAERDESLANAEKAIPLPAVTRIVNDKRDRAFPACGNSGRALRTQMMSFLC